MSYFFLFQQLLQSSHHVESLLRKIIVLAHPQFHGAFDQSSSLTYFPSKSGKLPAQKTAATKKLLNLAGGETISLSSSKARRDNNGMMSCRFFKALKNRFTSGPVS